MRGIITGAEKRFLDLEAIEKEVKRLSADKNFLIKENNRQTADLSKLKGEYAELEVKCKEIISTAEQKAQSIINSANEKLKSANSKESEIVSKKTELDSKIKEYENLIKTNEGKEKNLTNALNNANALKEKLGKVANLIKEILE